MFECVFVCAPACALLGIARVQWSRLHQERYATFYELEAAARAVEITCAFENPSVMVVCSAVTS